MPGTAEADSVVLKLTRPSGERTPDLVVRTAHRVYAVWYDLEPGSVQLTADSEKEFFAQELSLVAGEIQHLLAKLEIKPALDVELRLPTPLAGDKVTLILRRVPHGEVVARRDVEPENFQVRFEAMPPERLDIELQTRLADSEPTVCGSQRLLDSNQSATSTRGGPRLAPWNASRGCDRLARLPGLCGVPGGLCRGLTRLLSTSST